MLPDRPFVDCPFGLSIKTGLALGDPAICKLRWNLPASCYQSDVRQLATNGWYVPPSRRCHCMSSAAVTIRLEVASSRLLRWVSSWSLFRSNGSRSVQLVHWKWFHEALLSCLDQLTDGCLPGLDLVNRCRLTDHWTLVIVIRSTYHFLP
jgi:hypothetical protein